MKNISRSAVCTLMLLFMFLPNVSAADTYIFFKKSPNSTWNDVFNGAPYITLYSGPYWDNSKGSGNGNHSGTTVISGNSNKQMTQIGTTGIYYYKYTGNTKIQAVSFTDKTQDNYGNFWESAVAYCQDFSYEKPMYILGNWGKNFNNDNNGNAKGWYSSYIENNQQKHSENSGWTSYIMPATDIYFDASACEYFTWDDQVPYLRIGHTTYNDAYEMRKVTGTKNLWKIHMGDCAAKGWEDYEALTVSQQKGWTGSNTIYGLGYGDYFIYNQLSFLSVNNTTLQGESINDNNTLLIISQSGGSNGGGSTSSKGEGYDGTCDACTWFVNNTHSHTVKHTITNASSNSTNGSVTLSYIDENGTKKTVSAGSSATVYRTTIVTISCTPASGYVLTDMKAGSTRLTEAEYIVTDNVTITATYAAKPAAEQNILVKDANSWGSMYYHASNPFLPSPKEYNLKISSTYTACSATWYIITLDPECPYFSLENAGGTKSAGTLSDPLLRSSVTAGSSYNNTKSGTGLSSASCSDQLTAMYRVKTVVGTKTYYSNTVSNTTDLMSFYVNMTDAAMIYLQTFNTSSKSWTDTDLTSSLKSTFRTKSESDAYGHKYGDKLYDSASASEIYEGNVFTAKLNSAKNSLDNIELYVGNYYISVDAVGWNRKHDDNAFSRFNPERSKPNEYYNHYWCQWMLTGVNVTATVGNEYNFDLAGVIGADDMCPGGKIPDVSRSEGNNGLNIRYSYDNYSNSFTRAALRGAGAKDDRFLIMYGTQVFTADTGSETYTYPSPNSPLTFSDASNWVYQADVYATKDSRMQLLAEVNGVQQFLLGIDSSTGNPIQAELLGEGSVSSARWHMRVIYDYKINRIITAWLLDDNQTLSENKTLDANMMLVRHAEGQVTQVTAGSYSVSKIKRVYTVLEIQKSEWDQLKDANNTYAFWISLPYDCLVSDVFGLGNYTYSGTLNGETEKWLINQYNGERRAACGWFREYPTFWETLEQNGVDEMKSGVGYNVILKLKDSDFKSVKVNDTEIQMLRIFFPSKDGSEQFTLSQSNSAIEQVVPTHLYDKSKHPANTDRTKDDSNWNVIGVPGYHSHNVSSVQVDNYDWTTHSLSTTTTTYNFGYYYTYKGTKGNRYNVFNLNTDNGTRLKPTNAYMVQFGGKINWQQTTRLAAPRRDFDAEPDRLALVELYKADDSRELLDQTYVGMQDYATDSFDVSIDLMKVASDQYNIYTATREKHQTEYDGLQPYYFAANVLSVAPQIVPLIVQVNEAGEYEIALQELPEGMKVELYDASERTSTLLGYNAYKANLTAGTTDNRFSLILTPQQDEVVTSLGMLGEYTLVIEDSELIINGVVAPVEVRVYDALGKSLYNGKYISGMRISLPQNGVYLVNVNGKTEKVIY